MHPYLALLFRRDYFDRSNASLSCCFLPQGLFRPTECIPAFLFFPTGIISTSRIHLCLALLLHRDYFHPVRCISSLLFFTTGIISTGQMHLYPAFLLHRDYFGRLNASLLSSFFPQGLFRPAGFISVLLFCSAGIISTGRMHLYLAVFFHRDYFAPIRHVPLAERISASPFRQLPVYLPRH